jgi:hypothetical protein
MVVGPRLCIKLLKFIQPFGEAKRQPAFVKGK